MALADFEDVADTYFVGLTQQSSAGGLARLVAGAAEVLPASRVYPGRRSFLEFVQPIERRLETDPHVERIAIQPVLGRYGTSQELSVGLEISASAGFNAAAFAESVFRQARNAKQLDAFVGRVLLPAEWTDNARPGLTVLFKEPLRIGQLGRLCNDIINFPGDGWPIDGFTTIPVEGEMVAVVKGLRYIFLPEISIRWDLALRERLSANPDEMDIILIDQATKIGRLCRSLVQSPYIEKAYLNWFDVIVGGLENYDALIASLSGEMAVLTLKETSMTRKPFSEILQLNNTSVLQERLSFAAAHDAQCAQEKIQVSRHKHATNQRARAQSKMALYARS
jgi:hypothetical protein